MTDPSILRRAEQLGHKSGDGGGLRDSNPYVEHRWTTGSEPLCDDLTAAWWRGWDKANMTALPVAELIAGLAAE
jgi:hypothetical protein